MHAFVVCIVICYSHKSYAVNYTYVVKNQNHRLMQAITWI